MTSRRAALPVALLAASLVLAGCGGGDGDGDTPGPTGSTSSGTPSGSPSETTSADEAYGVEIPAGVTVTEPGSVLAFGDRATIAWSPRQGLVGALLLRVNKVRKGTIKDFSGFVIGDDVKASTPYYVDVAVKNVGLTDLSGIMAPLYLVDQTNTLYGPNKFESTFAPCAAKPLPQKFVTGKIAQVCLVYLAPHHGTFEAVSFRPSQEFNPITWTGTVTVPVVKPTKKPGTKKS
jgi:hypothetical protein